MTILSKSGLLSGCSCCLGACRCQVPFPFWFSLLFGTRLGESAGASACRRTLNLQALRRADFVHRVEENMVLQALRRVDKLRICRRFGVRTASIESTQICRHFGVQPNLVSAGASTRGNLVMCQVGGSGENSWTCALLTWSRCGQVCAGDRGGSMPA